MPRIPNTHGGGALTNAHGLLFEQTTSLNEALINRGYIVSSEGEVKNSRGLILGYSRSKTKFIKYLKEHDVDLSVNSGLLLPDDAFINIINKTIYIIEKKFQNVTGSVDEKLQTCLYKKQQYTKLALQMKYNLEYTYVLSNWFTKSKYADVLDFVKEVGCHYFFNELPLEFLGI